ncbi:disulfide oxidoreductase [Limnochorda pilosa]|uniref:2-oxoglutarate dehydrogenase n=1 Tax=Limnochorda pilosa TaxID=1555112 RepID=A0A0K2SIC0_LIMPI|nr:disulfide oxidoreductase [Limnochorda pilosa]BAS26853.1 2-oxoglutarate dehydrogenase [Limnochorda pilosa]
MPWLERHGLTLAWLIALVATAGSIYASEVRQFLPCTLCWVERIFMFPLVLILGLASLRRDRGVVDYVLPLTVLGGLTSLYHFLLQKVPALESDAFCAAGVPCSVQYVNWLGFVTLPFLAWVAFTAMTLLLVACRRAERQNDPAQGAVPESSPGPAR